MSHSVKQQEEEKPGAVVVASHVPIEIANLVREDAAAEDRSPSYVICRILKAHYARRRRQETRKAA